MTKLPQSPFDLLIIGGGINGVGIARDAALLREATWGMVSELHLALPIDYASYSRENLDRFDREWWAKIRKPFFGTVEADIEFGPGVRS